MDKEVREAFYGKYIAEYFVHAQTVCTRPLLGGGEGPGDEAMLQYDAKQLLKKKLHGNNDKTLDTMVISDWKRNNTVTSSLVGMYLIYLRCFTAL